MTTGLIARFGEKIKVQRFLPGRQVGATFVDGGYEVLTLYASIQPVKGDDLIQEPQGQRTSNQVKVYTEVPLNPTDEKKKIKADIITWRGRKYEVQTAEDWRDLTLRHFKCLARQLTNT